MQEDASFSEEDMRLPDEKDIPLFTGEDVPLFEDQYKELSAQLQASILEDQGTKAPKEQHLITESEKGEEMPVPLEMTPAVGVTARQRRGPEREQSPGVTPRTPRLEEPKRKRPSIGLELSPLSSTPGSHRRKRQLVFADQEVQIHKSDLKEQMMYTEDTLRPFVIPSAQHRLTGTELLSLPSRRDFRYPSFLKLWKRCAKTVCTQGSDSDIEKQFWTVASDEEAVSSAPELSPIQEAQDLLQQDKEESMEAARLSASASKSSSRLGEVLRLGSFIDQSADLDISSDTGGMSAKRPRLSADKSMDRKSSRASPIPDIDISSMPSKSIPMPPVLEEEREEHYSSMDELLDIDSAGSGSGSAKSAEIVHQAVLRRLLHLTANVDLSVTFREFCPPASSTRAKAASDFTAVLELCAQNRIHLTQRKPFGNIYIMRGPAW